MTNLLYNSLIDILQLYMLEASTYRYRNEKHSLLDGGLKNTTFPKKQNYSCGTVGIQPDMNVADNVQIKAFHGTNCKFHGKILGNEVLQSYIEKLCKLKRK